MYELGLFAPLQSSKGSFLSITASEPWFGPKDRPVQGRGGGVLALGWVVVGRPWPLDGVLLIEIGETGEIGISLVSALRELLGLEEDLRAKGEIYEFGIFTLDNLK